MQENNLAVKTVEKIIAEIFSSELYPLEAIDQFIAGMLTQLSTIHLTYNEITMWYDNKLRGMGRERVETHLKQCSMCRKRDRTLRKELRYSPSDPASIHLSGETLYRLPKESSKRKRNQLVAHIKTCTVCTNRSQRIDDALMPLELIPVTEEEIQWGRKKIKELQERANQKQV